MDLSGWHLIADLRHAASIRALSASFAKEANKVSIWCICSAETVVGPYSNEHIILLCLNEAGDRVRKFVEFVDSEYSASRFAEFSRFLKARKQATTGKAKI